MHSKSTASSCRQRPNRCLRRGRRPPSSPLPACKPVRNPRRHRPTSSAPPTQLQGTTLMVGGRPFLLRGIEWNHEPFAFLAARGFNTVWLDEPPTREQSAEAARAGLWLIATPPAPERTGQRRNRSVARPRVGLALGKSRRPARAGAHAALGRSRAQPRPARRAADPRRHRAAIGCRPAGWPTCSSRITRQRARFPGRTFPNGYRLCHYWHGPGRRSGHKFPPQPGPRTRQQMSALSPGLHLPPHDARRSADRVVGHGRGNERLPRLLVSIRFAARRERRSIAAPRDDARKTQRSARLDEPLADHRQAGRRCGVHRFDGDGDRAAGGTGAVTGTRAAGYRVGRGDEAGRRRRTKSLPSSCPAFPSRTKRSCSRRCRCRRSCRNAWQAGRASSSIATPRAGY